MPRSHRTNSEIIEVKKDNQSREVTAITFRGEDISFDEALENEFEIQIRESELHGFRLSDIPRGIWIIPVSEEGYSGPLTIQRWSESGTQICIEDRITSHGWNLDLTPEKFVDALIEAIKYRQKIINDIYLNDIQYYDDFPESWKVSWNMPLGEELFIEEAIRLADQVQKEIEALQWQIILENAPHLNAQTTGRSVGVFLSHSWVDKAFARRLAGDLKARGFRVWLDEAEMLPGDSLIKKLEHAIHDMDYLCVVLSPNSVKSEWVQREVEIALHEEIEGKKIKVLPLLHKKCDIPPFIRSKIYADCTTEARYHKALADIVRRAHKDMVA